MNRVAHLSAFAILLTLAACPTAPAEPVTPTEVMRSSTLPWLCSIDGGRWCDPCTGTGCPQGDSGALCCAGNACVVWSGGTCSGVLGWCTNYTTKESPTGITEAFCHDAED